MHHSPVVHVPPPIVHHPPPVVHHPPPVVHHSPVVTKKFEVKKFSPYVPYESKYVMPAHPPRSFHVEPVVVEKVKEVSVEEVKVAPTTHYIAPPPLRSSHLVQRPPLVGFGHHSFVPPGPFHRIPPVNFHSTLTHH